MFYRYEASDVSGRILTGEFEAHDKQGVIDYLQKKSLIPVKIEGLGDMKKLSLSNISFFEKVTPLDRIVMVRNLAATVKAGLSILEALDIMIADATKDSVKKILIQAKTNIQNGKPLSATFASYKKIFPVIFVGLIKAGEMSGQLGKTLGELTTHLGREYNLVKKIKSALAYPLILLVASLGVVIMLMTFVLPRLTKAFAQSGVSLPLPTKIILAISAAMTFSFTLDIIVLAIVIWFFVFFRKTTAGKRFFLRAGLKIPVVKELIKKVALVRFSRTLGTLIASGIPITEALQLTAESVGNDYYKDALLGSEKQIRNGVPFSRTLEPYPQYFPRFLVGLIVVGEKTGTMDNVLKTFADFYDEEIDNDLKDLTTFIEPVMLLIMGLIIGTVAVSILMPIYKLVGSFV